MNELCDLLVLWREVYRVNRKAAACELGISQAQYWRIESGLAPISMARLRKIGESADLSLNTLLIAFMVMDENVQRSVSDDTGDRVIRWLHARLEVEGRRREPDSAARQLLGRPQTLEALIQEFNLAAIAIDEREARRSQAPSS